MPDDKPRTAAVPTWVTVFVAFLAIVSYLGMVVVLYLQRGQDEQSWGRALSLYTGVQAVAFAAFGWALGTQVGRGAVDLASQHARDARHQAEAKEQALTLAIADRAAREHEAEQERRRGTQLAIHLRDQHAAARAQAETRPAAPRSAAAGPMAAETMAAETMAVVRALYPEIFDRRPDPT